MNVIHPKQLGLKDIYTSNFLTATSWAFVMGQKRCGVDINTAIRDYMHMMDCPDLEFNTLRLAFYRKSKEFQIDAKGISEDAKSVFCDSGTEKAINNLKDEFHRIKQTVDKVDQLFNP